MYLHSAVCFLSQYSKFKLCDDVQHVTDELKLASQQNMSRLEFKMASGVSNSATQGVLPQQTLRELASLQHGMQQQLVSAASQICDNHLKYGCHRCVLSHCATIE